MGGGIKKREMDIFSRGWKKMCMNEFFFQEEARRFFLGLPTSESVIRWDVSIGCKKVNTLHYGGFFFVGKQKTFNKVD